MTTLLSLPAVRLAIFFAIIALVLSLHGLIWRGIRRLLDRRDGLIFTMAGQFSRPTRLILIALVTGIVLPLLRLPIGWNDTLEHAAVALLLVAMGWIALIVTRFLTERGISRTSMEEEAYGERGQATQLRVLQKVANILIFLLTSGLVLSTFEGVRSYGVSLFASAGAAGIVLGFAARPVLANLIAGIQIALTQPIRLNDVVIVENEWGWIEEIRATYVVIRIWDLRRLVVPLSHFIEKPFQNWTRESSTIIGQVSWHLDWTAPVAQMRDKLREICEGTELWDGKTVVLQVIETSPEAIELRGLMSARNAPRAWDLRCEVREKMIGWLQRAHPYCLPKTRAEMRASVERTRPAAVPANDPAPEREGGVSGIGRA